MRHLFSTLFAIFLTFIFAYIVWAQPVNKTQYLACADMTATISEVEVRVNGIVEPGIYEVRGDGYTNLLSVAGYLPGAWTFDAKVYGAEPGVTIPDWSGYSNLLAIIKPAKPQNMRYSEGYIVCDPQPQIVATLIHVNGIETDGLNEVVNGELRLFYVADKPAATYTVYAALTDLSGWNGDYSVNPTVVVKGDAPSAPVLRILGP